MNALIIRNRAIVEDAWQTLRADANGTLPDARALPAGKVLLPLALWQSARDALRASRPRSGLGVWLPPDSDPAALADDFSHIALIGVDFPKFSDGRGYSIARLLRERYGYQGELRALGDVLRDQLAYMERCGFNAFAVRADKDIHDALKAFGEITIHYQGAVDHPSPWRLRDAAQQEAGAA